jgi:uncharacterized protein (TIGR00255 family)
MKSMTGYGRGQMSGDKYDVTVELSSVNRKSLDVSVSLTKEWSGLERMVSEKIRNVLSRGSVRANVEILKKEVEGELEIDEALVHRTLDKLGDIARARGIRTQMDYETLLRVVMLNREDSSVSRKQDVEVVSALVNVSLDQAVAAFVAMRGKEGGALEKDLLERNERLLDLVYAIRTQSKGTVESYRDALLQRLKQLGVDLDLNDERLLKELALFADKADTTEELTRLESHLSQFRSTVIAARSSDEPVGRKLEFLIQEINREFNTIGSKANNVEVTRSVLDAKNEVERQREQVQNVE